MKKNMIALAVAGALVAPVAMAEVSISGGLQAELVQIGGDATSPDGLYAADGWEHGKENSGNYGFLKFAASEDLGGGMKALAVYNMNTHVGDESNAVGTRDAYVGLSAGFGTILAGTLATPYKSSTVGYDPMLATSFQARGSFGMSKLQNGYVGNAVAYANSFGGGMVKLVAALVLDEAQKGDGVSVAGNEDKTNGKHAKSISVNLAPMSGLDVAIAWIDMSKMGSCDANTGICSEGADKNAATKVGVKYSAGAITVAGQVEMLQEGVYGTDKGNVMYLTGTFAMDDANSISASFGRTDKKVAGADENGDYAAVGFKHAFSKSTSTLVGFRQSKHGDDKETAVGAGLRVSF